jgi:hypothetical protein
MSNLKYTKRRAKAKEHYSIIMEVEKLKKLIEKYLKKGL